MKNLNLKTIVLCALAIIEIFFIFTSNWAYETFAGETIEAVEPTIEWLIAFISAILILIFIWRKKEHQMVNFILIGSFLIFLIRSKVFGLSGVESLKDYGEVSIQMTTKFWIMFAISILMFGVDIAMNRMTVSKEANQVNSI